MTKPSEAPLVEREARFPAPAGEFLRAVAEGGEDAARAPGGDVEPPARREARPAASVFCQASSERSRPAVLEGDGDWPALAARSLSEQWRERAGARVARPQAPPSSVVEAGEVGEQRIARGRGGAETWKAVAGHDGALTMPKSATPNTR